MPPLRPPHAAIEGVERILRQVCPRAFAYRLEAGNGGWTLLVERAADAGWRAHALAVDPAELSESLRDAALRDRLSGAWARRLGTS
jgi:hypothetical protein